MNNTKPLFKRAGAYIIDLCIVVIIASIISSIPFLNKELDKYQEIYKEYETEYNAYMEPINLLNASYEDEELTEEEYNKFQELMYYELITEKYDDKKLTKEEHQEIIEKINKDFDVVSKNYVYLLNKNSITNTIITLICTLLYFGVFQYLFKGQTIGKKILKLQVVSATDKKLNVLTFVLRSLLINDILLNTIGTIFLIVASKQVYTNASNTITTLISIFEGVVIFTVITRQDARGIHDLIFGTKVIYTGIKQENTEDKEIEIKETQKKKATTNKNNKTTKTKKTNKKTVDAEYKEK